MNANPLSRRAFLKGEVSRLPILPPGVSPSSLEQCTACNRCAERCPTSIIRLVAGVPRVDLSIGECTFCRECLRVCPEPVFDAERFQFNHVAEVSGECLAAKGVACQSCGEACPAQAIGFRPRIGGPFLPVIDPTTCTGCGACLQVCPVDAIAVRSLGEVSNG
ncbi:ferredoxin-type protein NapF [Rhizobium sp. Root1220]|uniref:ferredoxin-type protein NapF n=1 Tax=Rhizobium sp. Root1220 TaxID=1736432 RepID=UPI0009EA5D27|nr:ferredoxin-type protein NapF [Rhizobium sp. Root1220]